MHLSRFKKTQLLVGIFSIWKQLWIELEKKLLVIYNTLENPSALLDIILYAWLSSSYECNGIRPCILHPFLNLFFYLSYLGGQQWNSTLCVWCTHLDILQSLEFYVDSLALNSTDQNPNIRYPVVYTNSQFLFPTNQKT